MQILSTIRDEAVLGQILKMLEDSRMEEAVGQGANGTPISHQELVADLAKSESDIQEGRVWTGAELIKDFENQASNAEI